MFKFLVKDAPSMFFSQVDHSITHK